MLKQTLTLCAAALTLSAAAQQKANIVFIGNSITQGAMLEDVDKNAPPAVAARTVGETIEGLEVNFTNLGISGATTTDWHPTQGKLYPSAVEAANTYAAQPDALLIFSISLGTNDSASDTVNGPARTDEQYTENLKTLIDSLALRFPDAHFVLHQPLWYSDNTYNTARYLVEGQQRLDGYRKDVLKIVEDYRQTTDKVHIGDCTAWDIFRGHGWLYRSENGKAGTFFLHPNQEGADLLGKLWAQPIIGVVRTMQPKTVTLKSGAKLYVYASRSGKADKAVVILPGGGYTHLATQHEGTHVANWMSENDVTAFVLLYTMPNGNPDIPNTDAKEAIEYARDHAAELGDYKEVGIMGSSAGGHLASTVATHTKLVDFQILLYPVISMDPELTHRGSHDNLLGANASESLNKKYSNDLQTSKKTPRAFIALSLDDTVVPPATNGIPYAQALTKNGVAATLLCYPSGEHGWGFRDSFTYSKVWKAELLKFLKD